ncbi:MAG: helix-turn-helix domain-containing protein [Candidatus Woesearchaeota archaeon]|nr:helix-turn-helix domain-containing protein [Candidatus Woesearchaeota archaeon]
MEEIFKELGLSDKEIKAYLKLLELGQATTQRLSEVTAINRITLYDILRYLIEKGFVGYTIIDKVKYFYATPPRNVLNMLKEKERKFVSILPELESKMEIIGKRPTFQLFEGKEGINTVNEDVLREKNEILAYGSSQIINKIIKYQAIDFMKKRIKNKIKWKGISDSGFKEHIFFEKPEYKKITVLKVDDSFKNIGTWNYIYNNKIAILSFNKENFVGIIIEDETINKTAKLIFEKLWKQAKKS